MYLPSADLLKCEGFRNAVNLFTLVDKEQGRPHREVKPSFGYFLTLTHDLHASDPRDCVYGMLGLRFASPRIPPQLSADYRKSVAEVFRDATRYALFEPDIIYSLNILRVISPQSQHELEDPGYVSWALDLNRLALGGNHPTPFGHIFDCCGISSKTPSRTSLQAIGTHEDSIELTGFVLDKIDDVSSTLETATWMDDALLIEWLENAKVMLSENRYAISINEQASCPSNDVHQTVLEQRWWSAFKKSSLQLVSSVLMAGMNMDRQAITDSDYRDFLSFCYTLRVPSGAAYSFDAATPAPGSGTVRPERLRRSRQALGFACFRRRVFRTASEYMGVGPRVLLPEDVGVVLYGSTTPFALRPHGDTWQLLGQCYVQGIMYGEAAKEHKQQNRDDVVFRIR